MMVLAFASASAKTASWAIAPKYDKINRYFGNIYAVQSGNKWGLVKESNVEIVPAEYDFITPFINGYALAGAKDGNRYLLKSIISDDGNVVSLPKTYYLPQNYQFVSEGKLAVSDVNGKYGYIDTSGNIIVKCQFDNALPFKEGWGPVKQGNYTKYISEMYDRNPSRRTLVVDFHYGEMTLSSCFSDGKAVIAYNKDFALIGTNGHKIKKINESDFKRIYKNNNTFVQTDNGFQKSNRLTIFSENGKSGLKESDLVIVSPQFDSFGDEFTNGTIIASKGGKSGVLKLSDGELSMDIASHDNGNYELDVDRKGNVSSIDIKVNMSTVTSPSSLKLYVDRGDGMLNDVTSDISMSDGTTTYTFNPIVPTNAESCDVRSRIVYDDIVQGEQSQKFSLNYPIKLRLSKPGPDKIKANSDDYAQFSSTIYNDSNKPATVTATWSTGGSHTVTISSHSSKTVKGSIKVESKFTKLIVIKLSTGDSAQSSIYFEPFF